MPAPEALARFIARVEQNAHAEAIEEFYAPHASMRENQAAPRFGRDLLIAASAVRWPDPWRPVARGRFSSAPITW